LNNLGVAEQTIGFGLWYQGKVHEAVAANIDAVRAFSRAAAGGTGFTLVRAGAMMDAGVRAAIVGDSATVESLVKEGAAFVDKELRKSDPESLSIRLLQSSQLIPEAQAAFERDDLSEAQRLADKATTLARDARPNGEHEILQRANTIYFAALVLAKVQYE